MTGRCHIQTRTQKAQDWVNDEYQALGRDQVLRFVAYNLQMTTHVACCYLMLWDMIRPSSDNDGMKEGQHGYRRKDQRA